MHWYVDGDEIAFEGYTTVVVAAEVPKYQSILILAQNVAHSQRVQSLGKTADVSLRIKYPGADIYLFKQFVQAEDAMKILTVNKYGGEDK